jgi:hypothetical protein
MALNAMTLSLYPKILYLYLNLIHGRFRASHTWLSLSITSLLTCVGCRHYPKEQKQKYRPSAIE